MLKVTVTGGSGFIGSRISSLLSSLHELTIFDIKTPDVFSGIRFVGGDLLNQQKIDEAFEGSEVVIHLAGMLGVQKTESNPLDTLDINIMGTRSVMEGCRKNDVKKIIYSSSSEIYGEPNKTPIQETDSPIPITVYGVSKLAAEEYVKAFATKYGIKYTILRFFSVYGPGQSKDFVIPKFVSLAMRSMPLVIHGDGSQIRAFCHVNDIARGIYYTLERGDGESFNIGNDMEPIEIRELAKKILFATSSDSTLQYLPYDEPSRGRKKDIINRIPSIEKARKLLGYEPKVTLEEGIKDMIGSPEGVWSHALSTKH